MRIPVSKYKKKSIKVMLHRTSFSATIPCKIACGQFSTQQFVAATCCKFFKLIQKLATRKLRWKSSAAYVTRHQLLTFWQNMIDCLWSIASVVHTVSWSVCYLRPAGRSSRLSLWYWRVFYRRCWQRTVKHYTAPMYCKITRKESEYT